MPVTLLAIPGSLREGSSAVALAWAMADLAPAGVAVEVFADLAAVPPYSPDLDEGDGPPVVADLRARIDAADGVIVCTPEYAYGMPGLLKNALDWLVSSGTLYRKSVAALSTSPSHLGGHRALAWLTQTLAAQHATVPAAATFPVPFVRQVLDGDRVADPDGEVARQLRGALDALATAPDEPEETPPRYGLIGKMTAVEGHRDTLLGLLLDGVSGMPGCMSYVVAKDPADPDALWITEVWDSKASLAASLMLPSVQDAIARARPIIAGFGPERFETEPAGGHGLDGQPRPRGNLASRSPE